MTTQPFKRYWCMTPDGIGLCVEYRLDHQLLRLARVQFSDHVKDYLRIVTRPATFSEYLFRPDQFAQGIPYPLSAVMALFFTGLTVFAVFGGHHFPELGWRIFTGLFGPVCVTVIGLTMYAQYRKGR